MQQQPFEDGTFDDLEAEDESEWVRLDPCPTLCIAYATGTCCYDKHFDPREVMPAMQAVACGRDCPTWTTTTDKDKVNCKECLEMIHA